jgi:hypothetical protein
VTRDPDGSFALVQSRVVTATGVIATTGTFTAIVMAGLLGIGPAIKGTKAARQRAHQHQSGVGRDSDRLAAVFDELGVDGACVVFRCNDAHLSDTVESTAKARGTHSSRYPRADFLALLDRLGNDYDWIRPAVAEPKANRKQKRHGRRRARSGSDHSAPGERS